MLQSHRPERVAQDISEILSGVFRRGVKDPRVTPLSITRVRLSPDLRVANINVVPLGGHGDTQRLLDGLRSATGFLRRELSRYLKMRHMPELRFHIDSHLDEAIAMTHLLDAITSSREPEEEQGDSDDGWTGEE